MTADLRAHLGRAHPAHREIEVALDPHPEIVIGRVESSGQADDLS
ncbi:hypothetical protein [Nonomuraea sp. LPB2021202275-12-8]